MRRTLLASLALTLFLAVPAQAEPWSIFKINGNDTGGIIPWSPELRAYGYRHAAQHHCAGYHKLARITSVHPRYGDYVVFACRFPRGYDPVKRGDWWYNRRGSTGCADLRRGKDRIAPEPCRSAATAPRKRLRRAAMAS